MIAGTLLCLTCVAAVPRADHGSPGGRHQVVVTQQAPVRPGPLADLPEDKHLPEQDFIVHLRGTVREAFPPPAAQGPFIPQMSRRPGLDPNLLRHVMRARYVSPPVPPAASAIPPQMPRSPRPDPRLLRHRVARGSTMPVSV